MFAKQIIVQQVDHSSYWTMMQNIWKTLALFMAN